MASAALGKAGTAQGSGEGGQAGRQAQVGIVLSEPGVLAGTGEGQVRPQHLSAQTHPAGRPASRWRYPGGWGCPIGL